MSHPITTPLASVTARDVKGATFVVYALLGAVCFPTVAQVVGGSLTHGAPSGAVVLHGILAGLGLAMTVPDDEDPKPFTMLAKSLGIGALAGASAMMAGLALSDGSNNHLGVMALFGALYGLFAGALLAVPATLWLVLRDQALVKPSVVARERLTMDAGLVVVLVAIVGAALYSVDLMFPLCVALSVGGLVMVLAATLRTARLPRILQGVNDGSVRHEQADAPDAPALVWEPAAAHVLVVSLDGVEGGPFRGHQPTMALARVGADLGVAHKAIGATVRRGLVTMLALAVLGVGAVSFMAVTCSGRECGSAPCSGCDH